MSAENNDIKPYVVLKLKVNGNESWRRIPLYRLVDEYTSKDTFNFENISFERLCKYAILYSGLGGNHMDDNNINNFEFQLMYTDEEGDQVELSTDEELTDAVLWKRDSSSRDVLQILASVNAKKGSSKPNISTAKKGSSKHNISTEDGQSYKAKPMLDMVDAIFTFVVGTVEIIRDEIKVAQKKQAATTSQDEKADGENQDMCQEDEPERVELSFDPNFVHARHTCDGCGKSPIVGQRYHSTNIPDFDLCLDCNMKCVLSDISFVQAQDGVGDVPNRYEGFDSNFVHSRHTCDGCSSSPIVGYRWHSTNIPNYDICHKCKSKTVATDVFFRLAQYKPDKSFSFHEKKGWKNQRCSRSSQNVSYVTDPQSGDVVLSLSVSEELQRAIELSLTELKSKTRHIVEEQEFMNAANDVSDHVKNASVVEEVFTSEAKEEPNKLTSSDLMQFNESLVSTGKPIANEDIEKALFEASIASIEKPMEPNAIQSVEEKVEPNKLSSSDLIDFNESLVSTGKPIENEEIEKALFEASIASTERSMESNVIQSTMQEIVASLASEEESDEVTENTSVSSRMELESIASEKPIDESSKALSEVAFSSLSPSLAAEVISMDDLEYPNKNDYSAMSNESVSFVSNSSASSSFQDVSISDEENVVQIPVATDTDVISLRTSESDLSLNSNEDNENSNANLMQSENSTSFVSAAEREGSIISQDYESDSVSSATNASLSSEDSWNFVEENVHENIGSLLFKRGLN